MSLNVSSLFELPLQKLRNDERFASFKYPLYYPGSIEQDAILFIGMNPSNEHNEKDFECYDLNEAKNKWGYFKRMQDISDYCKHAWSHIDLFHYRNTNQKDFYNIYKEPNGIAYLNELLKLTDVIIKQAYPRVIVIANALAVEILKGEIRKFKKSSKLGLKYQFEFDESIGTYKWQNVPVFFCSMLSGQRALDIGSYERLKWHIKKVLN